MKKIVFSIILGLSILVVALPKTANAQDAPWYYPTYEQFNRKVFGGDQSEIFGERYTQAQVYWIFYSLQNILASSGFSDCVQQNNIDAETRDLNVIEQCTSTILPTNPPGLPEELQNRDAGAFKKDPGAIIGLSLLVDGFRNTRPASGVDYIAQSLNDFHIVPQAYAQGFGYQTLSASQPLWTAARNMAYGLLVLVFIGFAFAIMLRVKLSPQTVVTVQSALPKIIIAMILIWFSYAIAGLLIDLSFLIQGIMSTFIANAVGADGASISNRSVVEFLQIMNQPVYSVTSVGLIFLFLGVTGILIAPGVIAGTAGTGTVIIIIAAVILLLIFLAFVITLVRLLWLFLMTYVKVLLLVIAGPFFILGGSVGIAGGVTGWIKNLAAQLSVFVVASILIVFAHVFIWGPASFWGFLSGIQALNPFLIHPSSAPLGTAQLPGFGAQDPAIIGLSIGFVLLMGTPNLATIVRDMLVKPSRLQLGIGTAFAPILAPVGFGKSAITSGVGREIGGLVAPTFMNMGASAVNRFRRGPTPQPQSDTGSTSNILPHQEIDETPRRPMGGRGTNIS